jgi:ubiquinone/menaquinone biosynthesis C-methylase UbiE
MDEKKVILHAGCGTNQLPEKYAAFKELRLDIDERCLPHLVASITDTGLANESVSAVYCGHTLEHLYAHEVPMALGEFYRVLEPSGFVDLIVPDLQKVAAAIVAGRFESMLYRSPAGAVAPIDMLYGFRPAIERGNLHMVHKTGFTPASLEKKMRKAGFMNVQTWSDDCYNLFAKGEK